MCTAFGCLITKSKKVYWKAGIDSHDELQGLYKHKDKELVDDKKPPKNTFARIEIIPRNNNYLKPDKWIYRIDEKVRPEWIDKTYEKPCFDAFKKWKKIIYNFNVKEAIKPIHPFKIKPPKKITNKHLKILKRWGLVRDSVRDSVWGSVWGPVGDSVRDSVRDSAWAVMRDSVGVMDSVGNSVRDSVWGSVRNLVWRLVLGSVVDSLWGYIGYLFPHIKKWKYINYQKEPFKSMKGYPFQDAVKLWKMGLVASFDGYKWRLHGGPKAKILYENTKEGLEKDIKMVNYKRER
jgi:hypothetical protein